MRFKNIIFLFLLAALSAFVSCEFTPVDPGPTFVEQLEIDLALIDTYLEDNAIEVIIHESGIRYVVDLEGTGDQPLVTHNVTMKYVGTLLNGTEFDSNSSGYKEYLSNVISAWQIMVPEMKVGGKMTIYAPSGYCYGSGRPGGVPSYSNMIFAMELVSIN